MKENKNANENQIKNKNLNIEHCCETCPNKLLEFLFNFMVVKLRKLNFMYNVLFVLINKPESN